MCAILGEGFAVNDRRENMQTLIGETPIATWATLPVAALLWRVILSSWAAPCKVMPQQKWCYWTGGLCANEALPAPSNFSLSHPSWSASSSGLFFAFWGLLLSDLTELVLVKGESLIIMWAILSAVTLQQKCYSWKGACVTVGLFSTNLSVIPLLLARHFAA